MGRIEPACRFSAVRWIAWLILSTSCGGVSSGWAATPNEGYLGRAACAKCHQKKAAVFARSNHGNTWKPTTALDDVSNLPQEIQEGPISYRVDQVDGRWTYRLKLLNRPAQVIPIHSIMGGERFGLSFILYVEQIEGRKLARPTLVEARYMLEAGTHRLKRSPGLFDGNPRSYNHALGRVLSPTFAAKCLSCHAGPVDFRSAAEGRPHPEFADVGVSCERCHGPGAPHVEAVQRKEKDLKIVDPGKLSNRDLLKVCSQCHSGFSSLVRPRPEDLLISNQVTALSKSQCFIQSDAGFSCLDCHDPHYNAEKDGPYEEVCLTCHSGEQAEHTMCPVNLESGCIACHMPRGVQQDNFHLTDHWIRVIRR